MRKIGVERHRFSDRTRDPRLSRGQERGPGENSKATSETETNCLLRFEKPIL